MLNENKSLDDLLTEWHNARALAAQWDETEKELRRAIFAQAFPKPVKGQNKIRISHGMALIGTFKTSFSIDRAALEASKGSNNVTPLLDDVISYSPKVRDSAFDKLSPEDQAMLAEIVTEREAMPVLEIKPQNKVRW